MRVASGLMITFFLGGWHIPYVSYEAVLAWARTIASSAGGASALAGLIHFLCFTVKLAIFLWIYVQVRWTLPRFRYDQLMDLGWKTMLPWALGNTIFTAIIFFVANS